MTVSEHLMRPGTFGVGLQSTAPALTVRKILDIIDGVGGHIVVTPGRMPEGTADATMLGLALYTGRITARPSRGQIEGVGISSWLGNDDGTTVIETAITKSAASLTTWITDLLVNGIDVGTITNTTTYSSTFQYVTYREAIDQVCLATGAEYELRPDFTIDAAAPVTLFGAPTVVVTRKPEGVDGQYRGIQGGLLDQSVTAGRQARKIVVVGEGGATGSATNGSLLLKDREGVAPSLTRLVDAASEPSGNLAGLASATLSLSGVRREFNVSSTSPGVRNYVRPGSYVYVWDVDSGISDTANQIVFRGEVISPLKVRVLSLSWPIERGMGVYLRSNAATPVYTDLSDHVEYDDGDAFWTVGSERVYESSGSAARLGDNAAVLQQFEGGRGVLGVGSLTTTFTTSGTHTTPQVEGLAATVDDVAGRRYKMTLVANLYVPGGVNTIHVTLQRSTVDVRHWDIPVSALDTAQVFGVTLTHSEVVASSAAGSVYRIMLSGVANSAVASFASSTYPRQLIVEDIGSG